MNKAIPSFFRLGLIGYPLGHSLSPRIHQVALAACGISGEYQLYPIPPSPAGLPELKGVLKKMRGGEIQGLNVTIPHKQTIIHYLDDLMPPAREIGAVNTIYAAGGRLIGDNTDASGFHTDLHARLPGVSSCSRAIVLGAGGSARAIVYALLQDGWKVTVAARQLAQAENLIDSVWQESDLKPPTITDGIHAWSSAQAIFLSEASITRFLSQTTNQAEQTLLIVNTTPLGMAPETAVSPWPAVIPFPPGAMLYDLVYNPAETALLSTARAQGVPAVNGLGMLVEQAALSFERWTGYLPPRQTMYSAIASQIEENTPGVQ